jgi:hypothetical protein
MDIANIGAALLRLDADRIVSNVYILCERRGH